MFDSEITYLTANADLDFTSAVKNNDEGAPVPREVEVASAYFSDEIKLEPLDTTVFEQHLSNLAEALELPTQTSDLFSVSENTSLLDSTYNGYVGEFEDDTSLRSDFRAPFFVPGESSLIPPAPPSDDLKPAEFSRQELFARLEASPAIAKDDKALLQNLLAPLYRQDSSRKFGEKRILEQLLFNNNLPEELLTAADEALDPTTTSTPDLAKVRYINFDLGNEPAAEGTGLRLDHADLVESVLVARDPSISSVGVITGTFMATGAPTLSAAFDQVAALAERIEKASGVRPTIVIPWGPENEVDRLDIVHNPEGPGFARSEVENLLANGWPKDIYPTRENLESNPELVAQVIVNQLPDNGQQLQSGAGLTAKFDPAFAIIDYAAGIQSLAQDGNRVVSGLNNGNYVSLADQVTKAHDKIEIVGSQDPQGNPSKLNADSHVFAEFMAPGTVFLGPRPEDVGVNPAQYPGVTFIDGVKANDQYVGKPLDSLLLSEQDFASLINDPQVARYLETKELYESVHLVLDTQVTRNNEGGIRADQLDSLAKLLFGERDNLLQQMVGAAGIELPEVRADERKKAVFDVLQHENFHQMVIPQATDVAAALPSPETFTTEDKTMQGAIARRLEGKLLTLDQAAVLQGLGSLQFPDLSVQGDGDNYIQMGKSLGDSRLMTTLPNENGDRIVFQALDGVSHAAPVRAATTGQTDHSSAH